MLIRWKLYCRLALSGSYSDIVIVGDFNHNLLKTPIDGVIGAFFNSLNLHVVHNGYAPTHFTPNRLDSLIDYFVVSKPGTVLRSGQLWMPSISRHACVNLSLNISVRKPLSSFEFRDYKSV